MIHRVTNMTKDDRKLNLTCSRACAITVLNNMMDNDDVDVSITKAGGRLSNGMPTLTIHNLVRSQPRCCVCNTPLIA